MVVFFLLRWALARRGCIHTPQAPARGVRRDCFFTHLVSPPPLAFVCLLFQREEAGCSAGLLLHHGRSKQNLISYDRTIFLPVVRIEICNLRLLTCTWWHTDQRARRHRGVSMIPHGNLSAAIPQFVICSFSTIC